jgi:hypothetical protein
MPSRGFVGVPVLFLESYGNLTPQYGLDPAEVVLIISLMAHKWDERAPFPGVYEDCEVAGQVGGYARTIARNLRIKGLRLRRERIGYTNEFDLTAPRF